MTTLVVEATMCSCPGALPPARQKVALRPPGYGLAVRQVRTGEDSYPRPSSPTDHPTVLMPPLSKSDAQRAQILAKILGLPPLDTAGLPEDVVALTRGLAALDRKGETIDCGDGGAPFRFLLSQAAITPGLHRLTGTDRLRERPHRPLIEALRRSLGPTGLEISESWPVDIVGTATTSEPRFDIDGAASSQYVSSLLLAAAALAKRERRTWTVALRGEATSPGYLALTLSWLTSAGFELISDGDAFRVTFGAGTRVLPPIPADWSSMGYLLLIAWRTGCGVAGIDSGHLHPDRHILRFLRAAGLSVDESPQGVARVSGSATDGIDFDVATCPDSALALAAFACLLPGPSRFTRIGILRGKESDRVEGVQALAEAAGGSCQLDGETLHIVPPRAPRTVFQLDAVGDHRRVMAGSTLAVMLGATATLRGAEHVSKSFPSFFDELRRAGIGVRDAP